MRHIPWSLLLIAASLLLNCCVISGQGGTDETTVTARVGRDDVVSVLDNLPDGGTLILEYSEGDVLSSLYISRAVTIRGQGMTGPALRCPRNCDGCTMFLAEIKGNVIIEDVNIEGCGAVALALSGEDVDGRVPHHVQILNSRFARSKSQGLSFENPGAAPYNVTVDGCLFEENVDAFAAIIKLDTNTKVLEIPQITIQNTLFIANKVVQKSTVYVVGDLTDAGLKPADRDAVNKDSAMLEVNSCTFERNTASRKDRRDKSISAAGAAIVARDLSEVNVVKTEFTRNQVFGKGSKGGAMSVETSRLLRLEEVKFTSNTADQQGGALAMSTVRITTINGCDFVSNSCNRQRQGSWQCLGGGFFWEDHPTVPDRELGGLILKWSVTIGGSSFIDNRADEGGAGGAIGRNANGLSTGTLHVKLSTLASNKARLAGGAIMMRSDSVLRLGNNRFSRNRADRGGAIAVFLGGTVTMKSEKFVENKAKAAGGSLFSSSLKSLSVDTCTFNDSTATNGDGGAVVLDGVQQSSFVETTFNNNVARNGRGGALHYEGRSLIDNVLRVMSTNFTGNKAEKSRPRITSSGLVGGGGAVSIIGTENPDKGIFNVTVKGSRFQGNSALGGGAMLVLTGKSSAFQILGVRIEDNRFIQNYASEAGGTLLIDEQEGIFLRCSSGDRLRSPLEIFQESFCPDWDKGEIREPSVEESGKNKIIDAKPFGPVFASIMPSSINLQPDKSLDNLSGRPLDELMARPIDIFGQQMTTTVLGQSIEIEPTTTNSTISFAGQVLAMVRNGSAVFTSLSAIGDPNTYTVNLTARVAGQVALRGVSEPFTVELRECIAGEVDQQNRLFGCLDCTQGLYSFNPRNKTCDPCPSNGNCTGQVSVKGLVVRHSLVPMDGYWHSTPFSTQMHQCLSDEACEYPDRVETLQSFQNPFPNPMPQSFNQTIYQQCAEGHHGVLCGACDEGYGHSGVGECAKCQPTWVYVFILTGSMSLSLLLVVATLRGNLVTEKSDTDSVVTPSLLTDREEWSTALGMETTRRKIMRLPSVHDENSQVVSNSIQAVEVVEKVSKIEDKIEIIEVPDEIQQGEESTDIGDPEPDTSSPPASTEFREPGEEDVVDAADFSNRIREIEAGDRGGDRGVLGDIEEENDDPKLKVTELIKIMINFTQVTGTAFLIDFDWPEGIKRMVGIQELFSAASGFWAATECALPSTSMFSQAMSSVILNIATPIMFAICLALFWFLRGIHLRKASTLINFKHYLVPRLLVTAWSIIFFYYDSLTESFMKLVYCPSVDSYDTGDRYFEFAISRKRIWAQDTDVTCFSGVHTFLFYAVGVPGLLLITLGVPVALFLFIMFNFSRLQHPKFRAFFGFMYLNYDLEYAFWESAIMVRKALIVAIAVLAHSLGKSLQGVFMLGVIFLALVAHTTTRPLPLDMLDNMETWSLLTTSYTFFAAVVFSDMETSRFLRSFLSISLYIVNCLFVLHFSYAFLHALREFVITYKHGEEVARELGPHVGFFHKVYYLISAETRMLFRRMRNMFVVKKRNGKKSQRHSSQHHHPSHRSQRV